MSEKNTDIFESIVGNFFYGEVDEKNVFPYPNFSKEQKEIAKEFCQAFTDYAKDNIDSAKLDEEANLPQKIIQEISELGLMGLAVPEEYDGMGLDYSLYSRIMAEVAGVDPSIGTFLGAHQSIGYRALINEGSKEQKDKWLSKLATGEMVASFCLTEPGSGSDAYSIKTKAVKQEDGNYIINGQKLWITNAGTSKFYSVFCKTDHEIEGKTVEKISCFIVEKDMEGVSFGEKENKMGIRASETRAVYFDNVKVPSENLLGTPGKGFKISMNVLNSGRLSLGAATIGGMKSILELATNQANGRIQFGKTITEYGLIQEKLAEMAALIYSTESLVYLTTANMNRGMQNYYLETAVCKIYGSEAVWKLADMGMQIAAGNGYMKEYAYERFMRDARINLIFEGTNEILRVFLSLSGIRGPSENLKELGKISNVSKALEDPIKSFGVLTDFAKGRISKMFASKTLSCVHKDLEEWSDIFSNLLGSFAIQVENTLMKFGKKIIDNELPQARISNMVIELYVMISVLSRTTSILDDESISKSDKDYAFNLAQLSLTNARHSFMANLKAMSNNTDKIIPKLSKHVCDRKGYGFDIVDF